MCACCKQRPELELELQIFVNHHVVAENQTWSSGKVASALTCCAIRMVNLDCQFA